MKPDGYLLITEFSWVQLTKEDGFGMYYSSHQSVPSNFGSFQFFIDTAPGEAFNMFQIQPYLYHKAGYEAAGFDYMEQIPQYPDPKLKNDPKIRKYLDVIKPCDFLLKFKTIRP